MSSQPHPSTMKALMMRHNPTRDLQAQTYRHFRKPKQHQPINQQQAKERYTVFFDALVGLSPQQKLCLNLNNDQASVQCKCLSEVNVAETISFMCHFCSRPRSEQQIQLKQIIQQATVRRTERSKLKGKRTGQNRPFLVPVSGRRSEALCQQSFQNLFSLRKTAYLTLFRSTVDLGCTVPVRHGNTGNNHSLRGSSKKRSRPAVRSFLAEQARELGGPIATRFIREAAGIGIRDEDTTIIELPSSLSKRKLYAQFCYEQGYKVRATAKGSYGKLSSYERRVDPDWLQQSREPGPVCTNASFRDIWCKELPFLKIRAPAEDTCNECNILANAFRRQQRTPEDDTRMSEETRLLVNQARQHLNAAKAMRQAISSRKSEAIADKLLALAERLGIDVITIDYGQNLDLPHFGGEQPGEIYYFSPKNIYLFGVCDAAANPRATEHEEKEHLHCFTYQEETGNKGGNNVATMVMNYLEMRGWLDTRNRRKRLTIAADNCGGQNKNNHVVRLACYLVEKNYYEEVEVMFYVAGHTKNSCDRLFNALKKRFHKSNVMTFNSPLEVDARGRQKNLCSLLNESPHVTVVPIEEDNYFKDWFTLEQKVYRKIVGVSKHHYFCAKRTLDNGSSLRVKTDLTDSPEYNRIQKLEKNPNGNSFSRYMSILQDTPSSVSQPGLKDIKANDLYFKFRRHVYPEELKDVICPKPSDAVIARVAAERREKSRTRAVARTTNS